MVVYPIKVPWKGYRGSKPEIQRKIAEHNELATKLEKYLNKKIAECDEPIQQYYYHQISDELNIPHEIVRDILFGVDAGHNGLTVTKPDCGAKRETAFD